MPNNFKYIYKFISNLEFKKKNDALNTKKKYRIYIYIFFTLGRKVIVKQK